MSENSKIEWTDHTFNGWIGCTKVSPGCLNCYAEAQNDFRKWNPSGWGKGTPRKRTSEANWKLPVKWNREVQGCHTSAKRPARDFQAFGWIPNRPRVFCSSLSDWLDDEVPIEWLADLLALIVATPNLDWLLLTKRPENWWGRIQQVFLHASQVRETVPLANYLSAWMGTAHFEENGSLPSPPANVWIGSTVENQAMADRRIPLLLSIPARVRFLSCEPLLGPVNLDVPVMQGTTFIVGDEGGHEYVGSQRQMLDWVICGGESGKKARPMHPAWALALRDQCQAAGVPFLFKQWGEWAPRSGQLTGGGTDFSKLDPKCEKWPSVIRMCDCGGDRRTDQGILPGCQCEDGSDIFVQRVGKAISGRLLDGVEHNQFPKP